MEWSSAVARLFRQNPLKLRTRRDWLNNFGFMRITWLNSVSRRRAMRTSIYYEFWTWIDSTEIVKLHALGRLPACCTSLALVALIGRAVRDATTLLDHGKAIRLDPVFEIKEQTSLISWTIEKNLLSETASTFETDSKPPIWTWLKSDRRIGDDGILGAQNHNLKWIMGAEITINRTWRWFYL